MNRRSAMAIFLAGFAALSYAPQASSEAGWVMLFDGKTLDNFNKIGDANWRVEDGVIVADKGNGFLVSKNSYGDFQIRAEFWVEPDSNSGIFIRCTDPEKLTAENAYEVNIWDMRPDPSYGTGGIVNVAKVNPMPKTVDGVQDAKLASGRIGLQHGLGNKDDKGVANDKGVVKFRKLVIKPL